MTIGRYSKSYYVRSAILPCPVLFCPIRSYPTLPCLFLDYCIPSYHDFILLCVWRYQTIDQSGRGQRGSHSRQSRLLPHSCSIALGPPVESRSDITWRHHYWREVRHNRSGQSTKGSFPVLRGQRRTTLPTALMTYTIIYLTSMFYLKLVFLVWLYHQSLKLSLKSPLSDFPPSLSFPFLPIPSLSFFSPSRSQTAFKHMRSATTDMHLKSSSSYPLSREPT